jgi:hypothetical protein
MANPRRAHRLAVDDHADLLVSLQDRVRSLERQMSMGESPAGPWVLPILSGAAQNYDGLHTPVRYRWGGRDRVEIEGTARDVTDAAVLFVVRPSFAPAKIQQIKLRTTPATAEMSFANIYPNGDVRVFGTTTADQLLVVSFTGSHYAAQ